ncbi:TauD/TfdA family dioxygenase [Cytobacillus firmus]|uniref:TauD/TfdA family dioxygenase n=1 Tax=Cytobacillus firmus TaxID=1399 RepID=UPI0021613760|nr:TauD/TfdA family dioxygenase [Cytobacillus firmus]MCS0670056.1 TauD/TfdA family dioxygenase [Cytobacillus firmus]MCS0787962.1 TauD/TfdA family dioxygenase [Cytobacillus firmus]
MTKTLKVERRTRQTVQMNKPLVTKNLLKEEKLLPIVITPNSEEVDLFKWARKSREELNALLLKHGGILFRGFKVEGTRDFHTFIREIAGDLLEYKDHATPRSAVKNQIYTSTDFDSDQWIELHNEMAYSNEWPMKIFFYCNIAAVSGGETPIANSREIYQKIDPEIRKKFEDKQVMYVRNLGLTLGMKWQDVFQTEVKEEVEEICRQNAMDCIWKTDDHLRIEQIRPAITDHPVTGEPLWFNQITAFNLTTLNKEIREEILRQYEVQDVPKNSFYGDGTEIEPEVLEHIRKVYEEETVMFSWQEGDILMLDNMLTAHGRSPYTGNRRTLVGMTETCSWNK